MAPGLYDFFVFDAHDPAQFMKDFSVITGPAILPPKWPLVIAIAPYTGGGWTDDWYPTRIQNRNDTRRYN